MDKCPRCGSKNVYPTNEAWAPVGKKSMKCQDCYWIWWVDVSEHDQDYQLLSSVVWNIPVKKGGDHVKYKLVCRYYGDAALVKYDKDKNTFVPVDLELDSKEIIIVPFPTPEYGVSDYIGVYELIPVEEEEELAVGTTD